MWAKEIHIVCLEMCEVLDLIPSTTTHLPAKKGKKKEKKILYYTKLCVSFVEYWQWGMQRQV